MYLFHSYFNSYGCDTCTKFLDTNLQFNFAAGINQDISDRSVTKMNINKNTCSISNMYLCVASFPINKPLMQVNCLIYLIAHSSKNLVQNYRSYYKFKCCRALKNETTENTFIEPDNQHHNIQAAIYKKGFTEL